MSSANCHISCSLGSEANREFIRSLLLLLGRILFSVFNPLVPVMTDAKRCIQWFYQVLRAAKFSKKLCSEAYWNQTRFCLHTRACVRVLEYKPNKIKTKMKLKKQSEIHKTNKKLNSNKKVNRNRLLNFQTLQYIPSFSQIIIETKFKE